MSDSLFVFSIIFQLALICLVYYLTKSNKISVKYSLIWFFPCVVLLIFTIIPGFMDKITKIIGFQTASNMVIMSLIGFLFIINISLTVIVTRQKDKIKLLIQEVSLIKKDK